MAWPRMLVLLYAVFMISLAVVAFVNTRSVPSLVGGLGVGLLVLGAFALIPKNPRIGYIGATVLALLSAGRFIPQFLGPEGKMYPHGVIGFTSIAVAILLSLAHFMAKSKSKTAAAG